MSQEQERDFVEIRDPEIDAAEIMRRIRERIRQRRVEAEEAGVDYDAFLRTLATDRENARFDKSLYTALRQTAAMSDHLGVGLSLTRPSIPLLGPLIQRVRTALHNLALYYVNLLALQQREFNRHIVQLFVSLIRSLEREPGPSEVEELRQELARLRARVDELEARFE